VRAEDAAKAMASAAEIEIDGRAVKLDFSNPRPDNSNSRAENGGRNASRAKAFGDVTSPPSATLFVANVSFEATEDELVEQFSKWGTINQIRLPTDA
jgi:nucleolin